jgi:purine-binding chemotaxis protein CheW
VSLAEEFVVAHVAKRACAFRIADVVETMRPLPIERISGAASFVLGLSIVRGVPTPVVDLASWLGAPASPAGRLLCVRAGSRVVALAVASVEGVSAIDTAALQAMPRLVHGARAEQVQLVGTLDADLLVVLDAARLLSEDAWPVPAGVAP